MKEGEIPTIMSLESWKNEFYPVSAGALAATPGVTDLQMVDHAIRKFEGLRLENLTKHDVKLSWCVVRGSVDFWTLDRKSVV